MGREEKMAVKKFRITLAAHHMRMPAFSEAGAGEVPHASSLSVREHLDHEGSRQTETQIIAETIYQVTNDPESQHTVTCKVTTDIRYCTFGYRVVLQVVLRRVHVLVS